VEGASGGRADDQEGLGEVQTGEDSRLGIPEPCNLGVFDQGLLANFEPLEDREEEAAVQATCDVQIDELPLAALVAQVVSTCLEDQEILAIFDRLDMEDAEQAEELGNLDEFDNVEDIEFEIIIISSSYFSADTLSLGITVR
jgi:hypothetical protein